MSIEEPVGICLVGSSTQSNRCSTVKKQNHLPVLGLLVHTAQQVGHRPDKRAMIGRCLSAHLTPLVTTTGNYTHRPPD